MVVHGRACGDSGNSRSPNPIYNGMTWERIGDQGQQWSVADAPYTRPEPVYQATDSLTCLLSTPACG